LTISSHKNKDSISFRKTRHFLEGDSRLLEASFFLEKRTIASTDGGLPFDS